MPDSQAIFWSLNTIKYDFSPFKLHDIDASPSQRMQVLPVVERNAPLRPLPPPAELAAAVSASVEAWAGCRGGRATAWVAAECADEDSVRCGCGHLGRCDD